MSALPVIGPLLNAASGLWGTIFGNRQDRDRQFHDQSMASHQQFAAEFTAYREGRTWWDSLVDGLNRLPRPVMVSLVIAYFMTSWLDPILFSEINVGLAAVPEPMWVLLGTIVGFYFAAREMSHWRKSSDFKRAAEAARLIKTGRTEERNEAPSEAHNAAPSPSSGVYDPLAQFDVMR